MTTDSPAEHVNSAAARLFSWLSDQALPLWSRKGVDWQNGGFVEQLTQSGAVIADVRRARLVARQIFAFKSAGDLGWSGPVDVLVDHGVKALLERHLTADDDVVPRFIPATGQGEGAFDLYDQAFVLFGLAHGFAQSGDPELENKALAILSRMRAGYGLPGGGFAEHRPAQAPLKANPHMHLFEAALAWIELSAAAEWRELASEIADLSLARFIDPANGSLHEYFDVDWSVLAGSDDVVEPGHQAEWAWLLLRFNAVRSTTGLVEAAVRLFQIAEEKGLDRSQNRLINELDADLRPRDRRLRLWPQTERIKALILLREGERDEDRRNELAGRIAAAVEALLGYFQHPVAGAWWEHFDAAGQPIVEPARASSLYHIMGAANELARVTRVRLD
jgi:mannose-6-phosphate isomerase